MKNQRQRHDWIHDTEHRETTKPTSYIENKIERQHARHQKQGYIRVAHEG